MGGEDGDEEAHPVAEGQLPFCMKIMVFMGEAQCLDKVEIAMDTPERRKYLEEKAGKAPTFPNLEDPETGKIMFESNDIIDKFAAASNVDPSTLTAFPYYMENFFPAYLNMVKHIKKQEGADLGKIIAGESQ